MGGYKCSFKGRVLNVISGDQETKHLVHTRQTCVLISNNDPLTSTTSLHDNTNDDSENYFCWSIKHNTPKIFPVDSLGMTQVPNSGHDGGEVHAVETTTSRIGTEIWLKGISLNFMVWLKPQLLHCALHVSLIHFAKGDYPNKDKLHQNYTGINELNSTTAAERPSKSENTTQTVPAHHLGRGISRHHRRPRRQRHEHNAYDGDKMYKVLKGDTDMTPAQWHAFIAHNYPEYAMFSKDHGAGTHKEFSTFLTLHGFDHSRRTRGK